jgi:dTDP-glucose pyrophosphorylase
MLDLKNHIISDGEPLSMGLEMLNKLGADLTLFVVNENEQLIGTVTDGDIRRGLIQGLEPRNNIKDFMRTSFSYIDSADYKVSDVINAKNRLLDILPVLDSQKRIVKLINFSDYYSYLPIDALIMAGGEGIRLRPLTEKTPKPLIMIGDKPIIEHGIDWMIRFGIQNIQISVNYLGNMIMDYLGDGVQKGASISYISETTKLGTIGAVSLAKEFKNDYVVVMNSDLLTNINFEEFFNEFQNSNADMSVASIPYNVTVPYAVLDTDQGNVTGLKEKPSITYQSSAGIYLIKKKHLNKIPANTFYNATDLIADMISEGFKVTYYPILDYWLDIGKMDDLKKAENDIKHIKFEK